MNFKAIFAYIGGTILALILPPTIFQTWIHTINKFLIQNETIMDISYYLSLSCIFILLFNIWFFRKEHKKELKQKDDTIKSLQNKIDETNKADYYPNGFMKKNEIIYCSMCNVPATANVFKETQSILRCRQCKHHAIV